MEQKKKTTITSEFVSKPHLSENLAQHQEKAKQEEKESHLSALKFGWEHKKKTHTAEREGFSYRKLLRNTAICAVLALGIIGIKNIDAQLTNQISNGIDQAVESEMQLDEDLGRLKFVDGQVEGNTVDVSASGYSLPMEGEVTETFSETEREVAIRGEEQSQVCAILSGVVMETTETSLTIDNDNGTRTTYEGVIPGVKVGEKVSNSDIIGQLAEEILTMETVSGIGYVDSLSQKDLNETERTLE